MRRSLELDATESVPVSSLSLLLVSPGLHASAKEEESFSPALHLSPGQGCFDRARSSPPTPLQKVQPVHHGG